MKSDPAISLEQDLMYAIVKQRYGSLLSDEQLEEVRASVIGLDGFLRPLRSFRLTNDVEPFSTFSPFRSEDSGE